MQILGPFLRRIQAERAATLKHSSIIQSLASWDVSLSILLHPEHDPKKKYVD